MDVRLWIGLFGIVVYLFVVFMLGGKIQVTEVLKKRLNIIKNSENYGGELDDKMQLPFYKRFLQPLFNNAVTYISSIIPLSEKAQSQLTERLRKAGVKKTAREYVAGQIVIYSLLVLGLFFLFGIVMRMEVSKVVPYSLLIVFAYYTINRFLLGKKITRMKQDIEEGMPEVLDLLSVSVSAGLGFDQALQYVIDRCTGPFISELAVAQREIQLGRARSIALKNLSDRCEVEALKMFVSAVIQAETLGIAISNVLEIQADNVRQMHKQKIEERAAKLPVKMLIPLVFCIFPVMFIILLGPAVPRVIEAFASF